MFVEQFNAVDNNKSKLNLKNKNKENKIKKNNNDNMNKNGIVNKKIESNKKKSSSKIRKPNLIKDICIEMPNMGVFVFFSLFVICIPIIFVALGWDDLLTLYLPLLVPLAIIFTVSGDQKYFKNLYPLNGSSKDLEGYISKHLINFMAVVSIIYMSVNYGITNESELYGALVGVTSAILILFISPEIIPFAIKKGDKYIREKMNMNLKYDWHKYTIGMIILILIVLFDTLLVEVVYQNILN